MFRKESLRKFGLVLTVILSAGLFSVNIVDAGQSRCLPEWNSDMPILLDKEIGRFEFAPGDSFPIEANYRYARSCKDYVQAVITWQALKNNIVTNDIVFIDNHAKKTTAKVVLGAKTGDRVTIKAILTFADEPNGQRSEKETNVFIVEKPPAPKIELNYGPAESLVRFKVGFEGSRAGGSGNNFIRNCSVVLRDEQGNIVDIDKVDTVFGKAMPPARLKAKNPGIHNIAVACSDSYGTIGTVTETIPVALGDNDRKSPPLLIVNKTLSCYLGNCVVDFSRTTDFGKSVKVKYYDITGGNRNMPAIPCGAQVCKLNLTGPGVYTIKLEARFLLGSNENSFIYSDKSEAIIQVVVSQKPQAIKTVSVPAKTPPAIPPKLTPQPPPEIPAKPTPGVNPSAIFVVLIAAEVLLRRKNNNH